MPIEIPQTPSPRTPAVLLTPDDRGARTFSSPDVPGMPGVSTLTAWDFMPDGWVYAGPRDRRERTGEWPHDPKTRPANWKSPQGYVPTTQLDFARLGEVTPAMKQVAASEEHLTAEQIRAEVAAGRMVIPANPAHLAKKLVPVGIGRAAKTKVNANMGASPLGSSTELEVDKLMWAQRWGADTVMDLSTGGDLDACRQAIIDHASVPIGTVPIYSMIVGRKVEELTLADILKTVEHQAKQGVDYMTLHAGILARHVPLAKKRLVGIVSRGGALLAHWMTRHGQENPMFEGWDDLCTILHDNDVTVSIGDGLRPGGLADAGDEAQMGELSALAGLMERAWKRGVQVMIEGPGHVPFNQIEYQMKVQRKLCHGAPFYVLGPLVTDMFPGYDHITSCIGATAAAYHGAAMLCYVTPREHLGLPRKEDVKQGCVAYRIAAHAADVALGIPGAQDRDDAMSKARADLNWKKQFELCFDAELAKVWHEEDTKGETDHCAMCGRDWCAVRLSNELKGMDDCAIAVSISPKP